MIKKKLLAPTQLREQLQDMFRSKMPPQVAKTFVHARQDNKNKMGWDKVPFERSKRLAKI